MKLSEILQGVSDAGAAGEKEITGVTCDSRNAGKGDVFVCVSGQKGDGHAFAASAAQKGAAAVVCEHDVGLPCQICVENTRVAYAKMCANFYGNPQKGLKLIGITGTNGKTTITYMLRDILRAAGKKVGLIGTIQSEIGDMIIPARHTTPDPLQLHALLARMKNAGMEYVVMEVSSHALSQYRVEGLHFVCGAFTNLTQDHLDYHGSMENYYQAKRKLFTQSDLAVANMDDEYGLRLLKEISCPALTFTVKNQLASFSAHGIVSSAQGSRFLVVHEKHIERASICIPGTYSVSNALCAVACAKGCGIPFAQAVQGLAQCKGVLGRTEVIDAGTPFTVIRDYAHAPDGLLKILTTVRSFAPGRVVTLFGCAGERDRKKRRTMGEIVGRNSDLVILTSDNPRSEDPMQIVEDTLPGFEGLKTPVKVIIDRYDAIRWAIEHCKEDDILLLLGKGHEDYQVLRYGTVYFDERFIVRDIVNKLRDADTIQDV